MVDAVEGHKKIDAEKHWMLLPDMARKAIRCSIIKTREAFENTPERSASASGAGIAGGIDPSEQSIPC